MSGKLANLFAKTGHNYMPSRDAGVAVSSLTFRNGEGSHTRLEIIEGSTSGLFVAAELVDGGGRHIEEVGSYAFGSVEEFENEFSDVLYLRSA